MPSVPNHPQLITYVDRLAGDLSGLREVLHGPLGGAFGGVHLLPFFTPIDGADAGFDPIDHTEVDHRLGTWADVGRIGEGFSLMADLIVNHVSSSSAEFQDWCANGSASAYAGMFLTLEHVFDGPDDPEIDKVYRPRPWPAFTSYDVAGDERLIWTTFTNDQIDIDVDHPAGRAYLRSVLDRLAEAGVDLVRLDAVGYAIKRRGTTCFMLPETFEFITWITDECRRRGMAVLVEIHNHHTHQIQVSGQVDLVYDFALPPLVLHALHAGDAGPLESWLRVAPRNCVTVLDTHDGIGIADVAPDGDLPGLLGAEDLDALVERIHDAAEGRSREATGAAASNLDLYQLNCTFYEALGSDDDTHFLARLIQVLCPGIPQVYYGGLLAAPNQMELLRRTNVGRDINRPYYDAASLAAALDRQVVRDTLALLRWRTRHGHLFDGTFELLDSPGNELALRWRTDDTTLEARLDVAERTFRVTVGDAVYETPGDFAR